MELRVLYVLKGRARSVAKKQLRREVSFMLKALYMAVALLLVGSYPAMASSCHGGAGKKQYHRQDSGVSSSTEKQHRMRGAHKKSEAFTEKTYVCPEHPEIKRDSPGKCPKTGMPLKEKRTLMTYACPDKSCEHVSREEGFCPHTGKEMIKTEAKKEIKIKAMK